MSKIVRTKTKLAGGLTENEKIKLKEHSDLWIKRIMRTDPIEPEKIIPAIEGLYEVSGLKKPKVIIVPSPLVMAFAYGASISLLSSNKDNADAATYGATYAATDVVTRAHTLDVTYAAAYAATDVATVAATDVATDAATRVATVAATSAATYDATYAATDVATRAATVAATSAATDAAADVATYVATRDATYAATDAAAYAATDVVTRAHTLDVTYAAAYAATDVATHAAAYAAAYAATDVATRVVTDAATSAATYAATYDVTYAATRDATDAATRDATDDATVAATYDATYDATVAATYAATDAATYAATYVATSAATYVATRDATDAVDFESKVAIKFNNGAAKACYDIAGKDGLEKAKKWSAVYQGGNMWGYETCYLTAFRDILGLELEVYKKYEYWEQACIHGGFRVMHEDFCIVSDFPEYIKIDDQNRPHCENGPSHRWRDGWSLYHWHGVSIPREWIEEKDKLTAKIAITWENIEQRRVACEIIGWNKILEELNARVIDTDGDPEIGQLLEVDIPDIGTEKFLRVLCGTGRLFALPVPPEMTTALEAQAWTWGMDKNEFSPPEVRT